MPQAALSSRRAFWENRPCKAHRMRGGFRGRLAGNIRNALAIADEAWYDNGTPFCVARRKAGWSFSHRWPAHGVFGPPCNFAHLGRPVRNTLFLLEEQAIMRFLAILGKSLRRKRRFGSGSGHRLSRRGSPRYLRLEPLEDRRLLAVSLNWGGPGTVLKLAEGAPARRRRWSSPNRRRTC